MDGRGGDDIIQGGLNIPTVIDAGAGNDTAYGGNMADVLLGGSGADTLYANGGDDLVVGGSGEDNLYGETGLDLLYGGAGSDNYYIALGDGRDIVGDDKTATSSSGGGDLSANDKIYITNQTAANLRFYQNGNDLRITDVVDVNDNGQLDDYVTVKDFFLGGANKVELVYGSDGYYYDISGWA
jgi:serralysin